MLRRLIACLDCGVQVERGHSAIRCYPCSTKNRPKAAAADRARAAVAAYPLNLGGVPVCLDCQKPVKRTGGIRAPARCVECNLSLEAWRRPIRGAAGEVVARAIAAGDLPEPSALPCTDCGKPAAFYDHRDYTKPLQVDPVCRSCNVMRGPADVWVARPAPAEATAGEGQ